MNTPKNEIEKNLMAKAKDAWEKRDHKETLHCLLRLDEYKMDLVWEFETDKPISSLCVAKYPEAFTTKKQIIVGSEDSKVYYLSLDKDILYTFKAGDEITSVMAYDLTKDDSEEIIVGSKDCHVYVLDKSANYIWSYQTESPVTCISATDMNGKKIIIAGTSKGNIYFIEFMNGIFWKYTYEKHRKITGVCIANLLQYGYQNKKRELIAITDCGHVMILDYKERVLKRRFDLKESLYGVLAKDIDNDGSEEIMVCSEHAQVYCLDPEGLEKWRYQAKDSIYSIHCCDIDNNNAEEIILGTKDNYVYILDSQGNFKWRYQTHSNVRSLFSGRISHFEFYDLFVGLRNQKVYYYKLIDHHSNQIKIEKSYLGLLNSRGDEFKLLEELSQDSDEYFRKFSIENMCKFANKKEARLLIFPYLEKLLEDEEYQVRSAAVKALIKMADYESEKVYFLLNKLSSEPHEDVRNSLVECVSQDYVRTSKQNRKHEIMDCLHSLIKEWKRSDLVHGLNLFAHANEKFKVANYDEALKDFNLLEARGLDLIWREKMKGSVSSLAISDIDRDGLKEIVLTTKNSNQSILYVLNYSGQKRWSKEIQGFESYVKIDDIDSDSDLEIFLGCSNGAIYWYSPEGKIKGKISFNENLYCIGILDPGNDSKKQIICGCQNGFLHCCDLLGKEKWRFKTGNCVCSLYIEDIDGDNRQEIIAGTYNGYLFVLDSKGKERWRRKVEHDIVSMMTTDLLDPGMRFIILVTGNGFVYAFDSAGNQRLKRDLGTEIFDMDINDVNADGKNEIIVATKPNCISILNKEHVDESYDLCVKGHTKCLACCDIDEDGYCEMVIGSKDDNNLYLYKILRYDEIKKRIKACQEKLAKIKNKVKFERKEVFAFIQYRLEHQYLLSKKILLTGYLGTGKTEILSKIHNRCLGDDYIPVFIDLQHLSWKDVPSFLYKFADEIIDEISKEKEINFRPYRSEFEKNYRKTFDFFIKAINKPLDHKTLLILFDDFEKLQKEITKGNLNKEIFYYLEKLFESERCSFIITVSSKVNVLENEKEYEGEFLSNVIIKDVNFIKKYEARDKLIDHLTRNVQEVFQLEDIDDIANKIIKITGCQAHFIQVALDQLLKYIKETKKKRLSTEDWQEINIEILKKIDNVLLSIWDNCSPHEKLVLSCLRNLKDEMSLNLDIKPAIKKELGASDCLISEEILNMALKGLSEKSIFDYNPAENEERYIFNISLMRDWIRKTKKPFEIISENSIHLLKNMPFCQFSYSDNQLKAQGSLGFFLSTINFERKRWDTLVTSSQIWCSLLERGKNEAYDKMDASIHKLIDKVKYLAKLFDFSIEKTICDLRFPQIICAKLITPHIPIEKLESLSLIIPKYEKLDELFYDKLVKFIIEYNFIDNVFLILDFFHSHEMKKRFMESKLDLLLTDQEDLIQILLSSDYQKALLNNVIFKQVNLARFSPYDTKGPVKKKMFYGRLKEINIMVTKSDKSFAIVGTRQLGKTSLLMKVYNKIKETKSEKTETLYIDCQDYKDPIKLCTDILKRLDFSKIPINDIREFKLILMEKCQKRGMKVSLFLDEIDKILVEYNEPGTLLFKTFRSLYQEGYINLFITGFETLFMGTKDLRSPLFNFLEVIRLGRLDKESAVELIENPMKFLGIEIQNKSNMMDKICDITACYPNLIQCMCKRLVEMIALEKRRNLAERDIECVKNDEDFQKYLEWSFYYFLSALEKIIILLFINHNEFGFHDIDRKLNNIGISLNHRKLSDEIDNLCLLSIFEKNRKRYRFTIPFLPVILKKTKEIELEIEKLKKEVINHDDN